MFENISKKSKNKISVFLIYSGVAVIVYLFTRYLLWLVAPFIIALGIANITNKPVSFMKKRLKIPRVIGGIITVFLYAALVTGILNLLWSFISKEIIELAENYEMYFDNFNGSIENLCGKIDCGFGLCNGYSFRLLVDTVKKYFAGIIGNVVKVIPSYSFAVTKQVVYWFAAIFVTFTAAIFMISDYENIDRIYHRSRISKDLKMCFGKSICFGRVFIKTQLIIMLLTIVISVVGLILMKNDYGIILGIFIGILDVFPLFGTGTVYIPWTIICLIKGDVTYAAGIFTIYLLCYGVREILEPRLMGNNMGIPPVIMLFTIYAGVLLFGVWGIILGPVSYIIVVEISNGLLREPK